MTVKDLVKKTGWDALTFAPDLPVLSAYVCDLLSCAMAKASEGTVWITIQSHVNVVAVASLTGCACVVIAERTAVSQETLDAARTKNICIISAPCTAFGAAAALSDFGIGEVSQ